MILKGKFFSLFLCIIILILTSSCTTTTRSTETNYFGTKSNTTTKTTSLGDNTKNTKSNLSQNYITINKDQISSYIKIDKVYDEIEIFKATYAKNYEIPIVLENISEYNLSSVSCDVRLLDKDHIILAEGFINLDVYFVFYSKDKIKVKLSIPNNFANPDKDGDYEKLSEIKYYELESLSAKIEE